MDVAEKHKPFINMSQFHELLGAIEDNDDFQDRMILVCQTGMHLGGLRFLRFDAIDFQRKLPGVRNQRHAQTESDEVCSLNLLSKTLNQLSKESGQIQTAYIGINCHSHCAM